MTVLPELKFLLTLSPAWVPPDTARADEDCSGSSMGVGCAHWSRSFLMGTLRSAWRLSLGSDVQLPQVGSPAGGGRTLRGSTWKSGNPWCRSW